MFDTELRELLAAGYSLVARVGYRDRFELRARADGPVDRLDHAEWVQLVACRSAREVVVRIETPDAPSPRVVVLAYDPSAPPSVLIELGGLYVGGAYRVVERIEDPVQAEARWSATTSPACWVSEPAPCCC